MKPVLYLNKQSTALLVQIVEILKAEDVTYKKFDNNKPDSGLMPLVVEIIATNIVHPTWPTFPAKVISLAHYYEQNGDLMADPLMEFIYIDGRAVLADLSEETKKSIDPLTCVKIQPCLFMQDGIFETRQQSVNIEDGKVTTYRHKLMKDHISFTNGWFKNIKWQQFSKK